MITDPKRITDMALSTATMVCFASKALGPEAAAVVSGFQLFFNIFCPDATPPPDSRTQTVTNQGLSDSLDYVTEAIIDAIWQANKDTLRNKIETAHDTFLYSYWSGLSKLTVDGDKWIIGTDATTLSFKNSCVGYFDDDSHTAQLLGETWYCLTSDSSNDARYPGAIVLSHTTKTTALLCLTGSLNAAYWKAKFLLAWADEHALRLGYLQYLKDLARWESHNQAYHTAHRDREPRSPLKEGDQAPGPMPDWNTWITEAGCPVPEMIRQLTEQINYALGNPDIPATSTTPAIPARKGLLTSMMENWAARLANVKARVDKLSIQTDGKQFWYLDAERNETSPKMGSRRVAEMHMEGKRGALIAYGWDHWSRYFGLDGVSKEELDGFRENVERWKIVRASVDFTTYTTVMGDTLSTIAANPEVYGYAGVAMSIYYANSDVAHSPDTVFSDGVTLRIPAMRTYTVVAGDALISIAAKSYIYNDGSQYMAIYNANKDILSSPDIVGNGQVLRIPDLPPKPPGQLP